ncbi:MAG TPA: FCD domain-containing protein [Steroidobacteraceae bacterium]|nr:FCD domain-containing protein [Steroidobacteraceae bacterium]
MTSYIEVKEALRARITDGSWATGTRLPPERGLAEEFGASRNTIRKAIKLLAAESYLSTTENSRPVVSYVKRKETEAAGTGRGNGAHGGEGAIDNYILDASPIEVLEARLVIEPEAVALAALRARAEDIEAIRKALAESLAAKNLNDFEHWDGQLHQAIFRATRNTALIGYYRTVNQIRNQPDWIALKKKSVTGERQRLYDRQHTAIVTAIVNRLPDKGKAAMRAHLESVRKAMMQI